MPPTPKQLEQMLTARQVADILGVHPATVARAIKSGDISPVYKIGRGRMGSMRIPKSAVTQFLDARKVER